MVTYDQLHAADPERWALAAGMFRLAAAGVADRGTQIDAVLTALRGAWSGLAGTAALAGLSAARIGLATAYPTLIGIDQALSEFAETIRLAQNALVDLDALADPAASAAALDVAARADRDTARRLILTSTGFDDASTQPPATVPASGSDPASVATWWASLDESQHRFMIAERSADLTHLDGVPVDARDQAGRILLQRQHTQLIQRRDLLLAGTRSRSVRAELDAVTASLTGLDQVIARVDDPYGTRAYLLGLDADTNRAIIAIGDPDRTDRVLTLVPGMGSGLSGIASTLNALDHIEAAGSGYAGRWDDLSTVGWLDYAAPASLPQAMNDRAARRAVDALARFDNGLRATHQGPPARDSLLGYSYGSTVVGVTARDRLLSADDLIFVASPGVGVNHARDLHIDPGHVWSTMAHGDAIHAAINPVARLANFFTLGPPGAMWFGADPTRPSFGGRTFTSDLGTWRHPIVTHQSYFATGSPSLDNIAKIAMGHGGEVS